MVPAEHLDALSVTSICSCTSLLSLPDPLLKRILHESDSGAPLRFVCKAFSIAVAKTTSKVTVSSETIRDRALLRRVFRTFSDANRVTLDFKDDGPSALPVYMDGDGAISLVAGALDTVATLRHPLMSLAFVHLSCPLSPLSAPTLGSLASCGLNELELQDVSIQRSTSDGASNLLRHRSSTSHAQPPGQLSMADSIRARGEAMVRFAHCLPSLRRLSLCNAAFSTADVASLAALTQLEELSLDGAMECGGGGSPCPEDEAAGVAYKPLLASLQRLRRLRLPMPISSSSSTSASLIPQWAGSRLDSDDDEEGDNNGSNGFMVDDWDSGSGGEAEPVMATWDAVEGGGWGSSRSTGSGSDRSFCGWPTPGMTSSAMSRVPPGADFGGGGAASSSMAAAGAGACSAAGGWSFPPGLQELTIPLCSLNGPLFRAACEAFGKPCSRGGDSCGSSISSIGAAPSAYGSCWGSGGCVGPESTRNLEKVSGLRSLHVICAPGYTVWEGSFLNSDRDFCSLSRLGPSLESLHLSVELEGSGRKALQRSRLAGCFRHLRNLTGLKVLQVTETRQPLCFAARKTASSNRPADLLPYLLDDEAVFELPQAQPRANFPLPLLSPMPRLGLSLGLVHSLSLGPDLLDGKEQPPAPLPHRPWNDETLRRPAAALSPAFLASLALPTGPAPAPAVTSSVSSISSSSPSLDSLLAFWPKLQTLVAGGQRVVRSGGNGGSDSGFSSSNTEGGCGPRARLVMPGSLEEMMAAMDVQTTP